MIDDCDHGVGWSVFVWGAGSIIVECAALAWWLL